MPGVTAQTCARPPKTAATNYARKTQMRGGKGSQEGGRYNKVPCTRPRASRPSWHIGTGCGGGGSKSARDTGSPRYLRRREAAGLAGNAWKGSVCRRAPALAGLRGDMIRAWGQFTGSPWTAVATRWRHGTSIGAGNLSGEAPFEIKVSHEAAMLASGRHPVPRFLEARTWRPIGNSSPPEVMAGLAASATIAEGVRLR